ncbi:hypothetical protein V5O48_011449 [Marasmius crinis-equi]|uniref:Tetraspanin Tsp2 n=1 Tax=Marasmius crinis-equi TaxID=585013 RepID=A0ABR3F5K6_9AGAR
MPFPHARSLSVQSESIAHSNTNFVRRRQGATTYPHESRSPSYSESKSLPTLSRVLSTGGSLGYEDGMRDVELTPRPGPGYEVKSRGFGGDSESDASGRNASTNSVFARGLGFISFNQVQVQDPLRHLITARPKSLVRTGTDETLNANVPPSSVIMKDKDSLNTKVMNKWPQPQFIKRIEDPLWKAPARPNFRLDMTGMGLEIGGLEEGGGLGTNSLDQWTGFKWCLLFSVITVFASGLSVLVCAVLTWFRAWKEADVMYVADGDILILITIAASVLLFTSLAGLSGTLLNSRPILAIYTLLLWPSFISILVVGYSSYKRYAFKLDHKLNLSWSQYFTPLGRLLIQGSLRCCGYYSPLHEATPSNRCYPRTVYPGCKGPLYRFERQNLGMIWKVTFGVVVPVHIANIFVAMLCSNHVTRTFGKGMMPRRYRLTEADLVLQKERLEEEMRRTGVEVGRVREPEEAKKGNRF